MSNCKGKSATISRKAGAIRKSTCRKTLTSSSCGTKAINQETTKHIGESLDSRANQKQSVKETAVTSVLEKRRYDTPRMNTILREVNQIKQVEALPLTLFKKDTDLTPRSKAAIIPKVTQRLNFNADQVIFRNLTPLNVNDSVLIQKQCTTYPNKVKKLNKVPSPELCQWLEPQPALKHTIPEPELTLEFCDVITDPFESYLHLLN